MELFRQEYELSRPKKWGEITYKKLKQREEDLKKNADKPKFIRDRIRSALESHPVVSGPLDATELMRQLSPEEQCDFFSRYENCTQLILKGWEFIDSKVLRCISITMGESLREIDLSNSRIDAQLMEVLISHIRKLQVVKLNGCPRVDASCIAIIAKLAANTCLELYLSRCPLVCVEPLLSLAGCVGVNAPKLSKLRALDLSNCPLHDKGLAGVATACKQIRFLNLEDCLDITDSGVVAIVKVSKRLQLINLSGCINVTNKTALAIAASCRELVSLNLSKCSNVTDIGIAAIANNCPYLQCANLVQLTSLTEASMMHLTQNCKGLLMLNVTGCDNITINGMKALVKGLKYVQLGVSFMGFRPLDQHIEQKMEDHLHMIRDSAIDLIRDGLEKRKAKEDMKAAHLVQIRDQAARRIQRVMKGYCARMPYYRMWRKRVYNDMVMLVQRVWRGSRGRMKRDRRKRELQVFQQQWPYALAIQKMVRGHLCRLHGGKFFEAMRDMYSLRRREAESGIAVRVQAGCRRFIANKRAIAWREVRGRRDLDEMNAIIIMQRLARYFVARMRVALRRYEKARRVAAEDRASRKIQRCYVLSVERYLSKLSLSELMSSKRRRVQATLMLLRVYRGHLGRERARKIRIALATEYFAAVCIQRIFRGRRVLGWRDIRSNLISSFVLDRHYLERKRSIAHSRFRYQKYLEENRRDSASEEDDDAPSPVYVKKFDPERKRNYWLNEISREIFFEEPVSENAKDLSLINARVKVYWIVQGLWYDGVVTQFHKGKRRHRIEYDDGDHEWINMQQECDRIQVLDHDGSWVMFPMYRSAGLLNELRKVEEARQLNDYRQQAFRDALQWKIIANDKEEENVMFMSQITGEIRTGTEDAPNWEVQDDGFGFPVFYNVVTGKSMHEDPRFLHDADLDLIAQRSFIMQEVRYCLYFCKDLWEHYEKATAIGDTKQQERVRVQILNSEKPKQLASFLIRAKALYKSTSVVDVPMHLEIKEELDYANWLVARLADLEEEAQQDVKRRREIKAALSQQHVKGSTGPVFCSHCKRETKKHLDFCANCGHRNNFVVS